MNQTSSESIWQSTQALSEPAGLKEDLVTDVCVVGAGIAGLSVAYQLALAGQRVVVLDDGPLGGGQTSCTTAHLSNEVDDRYTEIERMHGAENARLVAESHTAAIDQIESIVLTEQIDCEFERLDGYLFCGPLQSQELLEQEYIAALRTGIVRVERVPRAPVPGLDTGPALRFARQAQFHPLKYLACLKDSIVRHGGQLYSSTHATEFKGGDQAHVKTLNGPVVRAQAIVVATNSPVNDLLAIHTKQAAYQSYVIGARVAPDSITHALYWDTEDPYHYVRLERSREIGCDELLIVGGEDHRTGQADDGAERYLRLEAWARNRFPSMRSVEFRWSGEVQEPADGIAFIGRNPGDHPNVYIATGDSGMGMTHGVIAGMLISDLILGRDNPWAQLYDPARKPTGAPATFASEMLNTAAQYVDWVKPAEVKGVEDVPVGEGRIVQRGLSKIAVFRDEQGRVTERSAVCPHLQCIVQWNSAEQTWDCPCHGSRFKSNGTVINGPANSDLPPV